MEKENPFIKNTLEQIKQIFTHYAKLTITSLKVVEHPTFEDFTTEKDFLTLPRVVAFLQDFEIGVQPKKLAEIFKKNAQPVLHFDHFRTFLEQLYMRKFDAD